MKNFGKMTLKEREAKYRMFFEHGRDAFLLVDVKTFRILDVNNAALQLYGYEREAMLTFKGMDISSEPEKTARGIRRSANAKEGERQYYRVNHRKRDGTVFPVEITSGPFMLNDRKVLAVIIRDCSENRETERRLRENKEYYHVLSDNNPYGVHEIDTIGTIVYANKASHDIFGYEDGALIGRSITEFVPYGKERDKLVNSLAATVRDQPYPIPYYHQIITENGKIKSIKIEWNYLRDAKGGLKGFISVLTDITEQLHAEQELNKYYHHLEDMVAKRTEELQKKTADLERKNIALREVIGEVEFQKKKIKNDVVANINELIMPLLKELADNSNVDGKYVNAIIQSLREVTSSFSSNLISTHHRLSPREIEVCGLIEKGFTNKQIADFLHITVPFVEEYRKHIRKKFGLTNKKVNLATYLRSLRQS